MNAMTLSNREHELLKQAQQEILRLRQQEQEARATEMALLHACHLIHRRGFTESGSLEMSEIDEELGKLGLRVWEW